MSIDLSNSPDFSNGGRDRYNLDIPASVRHNNPGATWPAPWMKAYGMDDVVDTIGGGNEIAYFPTAVQGAAANMELWHRKYVGLSLRAAITKWSGGNSSAQYTERVAKAMNIPEDTIITDDMINDANFMPKMLQTMSEQESGDKQRFLMTEDQWQLAHLLYRQTVFKDADDDSFFITSK